MCARHTSIALRGNAEGDTVRRYTRLSIKPHTTQTKGSREKACSETQLNTQRLSRPKQRAIGKASQSNRLCVKRKTALLGRLVRGRSCRPAHALTSLPPYLMKDILSATICYCAMLRDHHHQQQDEVRSPARVAENAVLRGVGMDSPPGLRQGRVSAERGHLTTQGGRAAPAPIFRSRTCSILYWFLPSVVTSPALLYSMQINLNRDCLPAKRTPIGATPG